MKKRYFVISDIEMGKGDIMDDFSDDEYLFEFMSTLPQEEDTKTVLVLNGDIFDFLKMDYQGKYPRYITEDISLWKLEQISKVHPKFFHGLMNFLQQKNRAVFFVIGNHDMDLIWPKVQERVRALLGETKRVTFDFVFQDDALHIEHGHSLDPFFQHAFQKPFEYFRGQKILNLPIGSQITFSHLAPFKKKFPKEEQFYPRPNVLERYPEYNRAIKRMKFLSIWRIAYNRFRYFYDPTYRVNAYAFFKHVLKFGFDFIDDARFLPSRLKLLHKTYPDKQLFVLGHAHVFSELEYEKQRFLVTDTWRDEYSILLDSRPKKKKTYAEIYFEQGVLKEADIKIFIPEAHREHKNLSTVLSKEAISPDFSEEKAK